MSDLLRYKMDKFKRWLRNRIADYLQNKLEKYPEKTIRFKKPIVCYVWILDRNWDHDCVDIKIYGLSTMTRFGYARPSDIDELKDVFKILLKVLLGQTRR